MAYKRRFKRRSVGGRKRRRYVSRKRGYRRRFSGGASKRLRKAAGRFIRKSNRLVTSVGFVSGSSYPRDRTFFTCKNTVNSMYYTVGSGYLGPLAPAGSGLYGYQSFQANYPYDMWTGTTTPTANVLTEMALKYTNMVVLSVSCKLKIIPKNYDTCYIGIAASGDSTWATNVLISGKLPEIIGKNTTGMTYRLCPGMSISGAAPTLVNNTATGYISQYGYMPPNRTRTMKKTWYMRNLRGQDPLEDYTQWNNITSGPPSNPVYIWLWGYQFGQTAMVSPYCDYVLQFKFNCMAFNKKAAFSS